MSSTPVGDELGRLIFEREAGATKKEMRSHLLWLLVAGPLGSIWILAGLAGVAGLGTAKQQSASFAGLIFGPLLIAGGALPLLLQWRKMGCLFQCHENGLVYKERSRTRKLLYRDVGSFTYAVVQQFINGGYAFTGGVMTFEHRDPKKKPIEYRWASQYEDEEINRLRDHISGVLAGHMLRRLKEGQPVRWTTHWTFMPKGLYILRDGKGEGPGNARTTPYDHLTRHKFKEGVFYLSPKDDTQVEENASEPNFFPGYFLLLLLTPAPAETTVPAINKLKKPG
ncbi:MAG: hypothetical protein K8U57_28955 [Planctomycetes bacterium]|nr:hypothetical protein [Planctomycetota bacterium]